MSSNEKTTNTTGADAGRAMQRLRREAGYRSAREFAERLGIPVPTYARYERQPATPENKTPLGAAWRIADELGCSIDVVVGRYDSDDEGARVQLMYNSLSPESRRRLDEYLDFIEYREHMVAAQGRWQ